LDFLANQRGFFESTVNLCKRVGFAKATFSRYSVRPGTAASKLKDDVSPLEKKTPLVTF